MFIVISILLDVNVLQYAAETYEEIECICI